MQTYGTIKKNLIKYCCKMCTRRHQSINYLSQYWAGIYKTTTLC